MPATNLQATARIAKRDANPTWVQLPIACFVGVATIDLTYGVTTQMPWAELSAWLVAVGVILGYVDALFGLVDIFERAMNRAQGFAWPRAIGILIALVLATLNVFGRSREAALSTAPSGLVISTLVVMILLFTAWMGARPAHARGQGARA